MNKKPSLLATDDEDAEMNNSTSTNTALLPASGNNGFIWNKNDKASLIRPHEADGGATAAAAASDDGVGKSTNTLSEGASGSRSDLVLTEMGRPTPLSREDVGSGGGGVAIVGDRNRKGMSKSSNFWYFMREYRCQILMLIAFIEFGVLIAGLTFYFAGVLTANCDANAAGGSAMRHGKLYLYYYSCV